MITIEGVVRRGGWSLTIPEVRLERGLAAVVGPNGAGKTSFARTLAGLEGLDRGLLSINELVVDEPESARFVPAHERAVGFVFQDHRLFDHLNALDNVAFPLRRIGLKSSTARGRAAQLLERVGLQTRIHELRPAALSGGERQRVAIARSLARQPQLLIVDEALASVDDASRSDLRNVLATSGADHTVLITHEPVDVQTLADEVVVLDNGRVVSHGQVDDVAAAPGTGWAAAFLGANVIAGRAHGTVVATSSGFTLAVAKNAEGPVHVTFPAHAVTLHANQPEGSARNTWSAVIDRVDIDGERARVTLRGPIDVRADVTHSSAESLSLRPGGTVWASLKATELAVVA